MKTKGRPQSTNIRDHRQDPKTRNNPNFDTTVTMIPNMPPQAPFVPRIDEKWGQLNLPGNRDTTDDMTVKRRGFRPNGASKTGNRPTVNSTQRDGYKLTKKITKPGHLGTGARIRKKK